MSPEEVRTRDTVDSEPRHDQRAIPAPWLVFCSQVVQLQRSSPFQLWEWFSWHQGLSSNQCSELCPVCWFVSWLLLPRRWPHIPRMVGMLPCRRFLESWSWHPSVFQTISSGQQASWCLFSPCPLFVASMTVRCQALPWERWESLLGAVSCLQALWQLFSWRWRVRKLWPVSSLHWSEDSSQLSTALFCSQLHGFCRKKMWCI